MGAQSEILCHLQAPGRPGDPLAPARIPADLRRDRGAEAQGAVSVSAGAREAQGVFAGGWAVRSCKSLSSCLERKAPFMTDNFFSNVAVLARSVKRLPSSLNLETSEATSSEGRFAHQERGCSACSQLHSQAGCQCRSCQPFPVRAAGAAGLEFCLRLDSPGGYCSPCGIRMPESVANG